MPSLASASASAFVKALVIGDSGTGKTGSLISLIKAGYKLRILDMDNKIAGGILPMLVREQCSDKINNVQFEPLRDKRKTMPNGMILLAGGAQAYVNALKLLDKWADGTVPAEWGAEYVLVIDSLTFFGDATFSWAQAINPSCKDPRQWYGEAQRAVTHVISMLTSDDFKAHVIVISHVTWIDRPDGSMKGYPSSIGKAIADDIPTYFEHLVLCESRGIGQQIRRTAVIQPTALIDAKSSVSSKLGQTLPLETALETLFATARG